MAMRPLKQKLEDGSSSEPWLEPEPSFLPPGASWCPVESPPTLKMLPKIKRNKTKINLAMFAINPDLISAQLTSTPIPKQHSQHATRFQSFDSDDTSKSVDEFPSSINEWRGQTLVFKQPLTPTDPDNIFRPHSTSTKVEKVKKPKTTTPRILLTQGSLKAEAESNNTNLENTDSPRSSPIQKQLVIKLKTNFSTRDKNESPPSKSLVESKKQLTRTREKPASFTDTSATSASNTDEDTKVIKATKPSEEPVTNGQSQSWRLKRTNGPTGNSIGTPKRLRSSSPITANSTPTGKRVKRQRKSRGSKNEDITVEHTPSQSIRETPVAMSLETPKEIFTLENDDFCSTCGGVGRFLCCDSCPKSFHFCCVDPPFEETNLPEGQWFCQECRAKRHPPLPYKRGLFNQLLFQLDKRNPTTFILPLKLKEKFRSPTLNTHDDHKESAPKSTNSSNQVKSEPRDFDQLTNRYGKLIACSVCKSSSVAGTSIARCEPCDQNWHLDCTNPPLSRALGVKLTCPNNSSHVLRKLRRPKNGRIIDKTPNKEHKKREGAEIVVSSDDEEQSEFNIHDIPIHRFFDTPTGISAPISHDRYKQIEKDGGVYRLPSKGVKLDFIQAVFEMRDDKYPDTRNSEILLALDEIASRGNSTYANVTSPIMRNENSQILAPASTKNLEMLVESVLSLQSPVLLVKDEIHSLDSVSLPSRNGRMRSSTPPRRGSQVNSKKSASHHNLRRSNITNISSSRTSSSFSNLSDTPSIAGNLKSRNSSPYDSNTSTSSLNDNGSFAGDDINPEERSQLIAIKRLMELKGKDALIEFLLPKEI